ncbi:MAG TPA: hypothetical protein EYP41_12750 [Anaerolineae bacterium]|nr:hypothetical protein [Anaerolineae bacterium]
MKKTRFVILLLAVLLLAAACGEADVPTPTPFLATAVSPAPNTAVPQPTQPPPTDVPTEEPAATDTAVPPTATPEPSDEFSGWPAPGKAYDDLSRNPVTEAEQAALDTLLAQYPPDRDDTALALAYKGLDAPPEINPVPVTEPLPTGMRENLKILKYDVNTISSPEFTLEYVSDYAYFWFDTSPGIEKPSLEDLERAGAAFDEIYERNTAVFGQENSPGIDGDPRIHIVNASPLNLCDVSLANAQACGLGGYFGSSDILPQSVDDQSNEREMFIMNGSLFGSEAYIDILSHEFRHMIESNYDANDWDWEVEGSAMLAEDLNGFSGDPISRGNRFLASPDQQLNRWVDGDTTPYYGQGYVINRYIYNRLGPELYKVFATHPDEGFTALDDIAANNDVDFSGGMDLWLDWLAALAIHNAEGAPEKYALRDGLGTALARSIKEYPVTVETDVNQFAADYYKLAGDGEVTINFTGSNHAQLLPVLPTSGEHMWLANRANYSSVRLTRAVDLSDVDSATLTYDVFRDIEQGYDFAYVSVSTDGGQTWQPLVGEAMDGDVFEDNPSGSALAERFYTGRGRDWMQETIDLTPYAGQEILLRFEYVTDPILTFGGIAFDNIAIPEINYYDDAETDTGWTAEGFVRATGYVPQGWFVQLITFEDGAPVVTRVAVATDNTAVIQTTGSSENPPILIIAAAAPMTLRPSAYRLDFQ